MSVYLQDSVVLLDGSSVATDEMCCCTPTGACCVDTDCSITTESDCTDMGGTYQGDDTPCDPDPCGTPPCCSDEGAGFGSFDGSPGRWLTKTTVLTASFDDGGTPFHRTGDASITTVETYNTETCAYECTRSGSSSSVEHDTRNGCQTLDCFTDTSQVCGSWEDHRIAYDSHGGAIDPACDPSPCCSFLFDAHFTNPDISFSCVSEFPNSGCCPLAGYPGTCSNTATTNTQSGSNSSGSFNIVATLSGECLT